MTLRKISAANISTRRFGLIEAAAKEHGITVEQITGPRRFPKLCLARWDAMSRLRKTGCSLEVIGLYFDRDHTSVGYGLKRYREIMAEAAE